ncbi:MAG: CDP-paratose 2-epimerase [Deltaproteobacteria bacterium]|nr:CDP-paratose 2-epimerase [Deltaproteobacteria bacterium]
MFWRAPEYRLEQVQFIPKPRSEVFQFFSDAFNLERLTPGFLHFKIMTPAPIQMGVDTVIDYRLRLYGIPLYWRTLIESHTPELAFVDTQTKGPYTLWHHTHTFEAVEGGTLMRDTVRYKLPFGILGQLAHFLFVRRSLTTIFDFRRTAVSEVFGDT